MKITVGEARSSMQKYVSLTLRKSGQISNISTASSLFFLVFFGVIK